MAIPISKMLERKLLTALHEELFAVDKVDCADEHTKIRPRAEAATSPVDKANNILLLYQRKISNLQPLLCIYGVTENIDGT